MLYILYCLDMKKGCAGILIHPPLLLYIPDRCPPAHCGETEKGLSHSGCPVRPLIYSYTNDDTAAMMAAFTASVSYESVTNTAI